MSLTLQPSYKWLIRTSGLVLVCCMLLVTTLQAFANTVRISDPVGVLNASTVTTEGTKLGHPLDIYTTNTYGGTASDFVQRTISAHLTSKDLIVIAIDTVHHYLAIVGGKSVPLTNSQYTSAGTAFKNNFSNNNFTNATIAAIQSMELSLGVGKSNSSTSSSSGSGSGVVILVIFLIIIGLVIISAIFRFIKRLLFGAPPTPPQPPQQRTGDGRDNFGGGSVGNF